MGMNERIHGWGTILRKPKGMNSQPYVYENEARYQYVFFQLNQWIRTKTRRTPYNGHDSQYQAPFPSF
jgi:hypothetical protein